MAATTIRKDCVSGLFLGQVMFPISPEAHRKAAIAAELAGKSLNR